MTMYYVATLARYVLVNAQDEASAREAGLVALQIEHSGRRTPINIRTVRPATAEETELWHWHHAMLDQEKQR